MTVPQQQKLKITGPVVVTANHLVDGAVVYRDGEGRWTTALDRATIAVTVDDARNLLTAALNEGRIAVGAYVAPVALDGHGRALPGNLRESIRRHGPTIALPETQG